MSLGSYNGFSGEYREHQYAVLKRMVAEGKVVWPKACSACGQTRGGIHCHNEDYDRPADFIALCFACHMMVHCRFRALKAFEVYVARLEQGTRTEMFSWGQVQSFLKECAWPITKPACGDPSILRRIAAGEFDPRRKSLPK